MDFSRNLEHHLNLVSFSNAFLTSTLGRTILFLFSQSFFLELYADLEDCSTDGFLKLGSIGTKVDLEITLEFETEESEKELSSYLISSLTLLSRDAQNELSFSMGLSMSCTNT